LIFSCGTVPIPNVAVRQCMTTARGIAKVIVRFVTKEPLNGNYKFMSVFQDYDKKRIELVSKMQTLKDFEKTDDVVSHVFETARQLVGGNRTMDVEWLLRKGMQLAQFAGVLDGRANEAWGDYKSAEMAFKSVRDALMLASKSDHETVTAAKASANRSTQDAEIDALAREQRAKNYEAAANMCNRIVMFIQTTVRWREQEYGKSNLAERGQGRSK
jgi:hypothetical protein